MRSVHIHFRIPEHFNDLEFIAGLRSALATRAVTADEEMADVEVVGYVPTAEAAEPAAAGESTPTAISLDEEQRERAKGPIRERLPFVRVAHSSDMILCPKTNALYFWYTRKGPNQLATLLITQEESDRILG